MAAFVAAYQRSQIVIRLALELGEEQTRRDELPSALIQDVRFLLADVLRSERRLGSRRQRW